MLLIIEALLILSALGQMQDHRVAEEGQMFPLDMAEDSVDDQYSVCREKMARLVKTKYLNEERSNSARFNKAWCKGEQNATRIWNIFRKFKKKHSVAIYVYTIGDPKMSIYREFNNDTRFGKQTYRDKTYKWYSLYFMLTDAIQILRKEQKMKCYKTFRSTKVHFTLNQHSSEVRFGSFTSSSLNKDQAKRFGTVSCFEITTCEGADVTKYSSLHHEEEVLIPPYEKFKVTAVSKNAWCDTVFTLKSSGKRSDLDCALFKRNSLFH